MDGQRIGSVVPVLNDSHDGPNGGDLHVAAIRQSARLPRNLLEAFGANLLGHFIDNAKKRLARLSPSPFELSLYL